jgi:curved DNA-binding protein
MNYYQILGINENASQDDIKKAYKKLAMQHHPDRGGDNNKFQEISQAYDTLSDPQKKSHYDAELNGLNDPFIHIRTGNGFPDFGEMFGFHFGSGFSQRRVQKNKDHSIRVSISFKQSYLGTQVEAKYVLPSGKNKIVVIDVPPGVQTGQILRYGGLGDETIPNLPPGNLNVHIVVEPDPEWTRRNNDLVKIIEINPFEAILGISKKIKCLDGNVLPINFKSGIQSGTEFSTRGKGFRDMNTGRFGDLVVVAVVRTPVIENEELIEEIKKLNAKISTLP